MNPIRSFGVFLLVSPRAVVDLICSVDSPHSGFTGGNLFQSAWDLFPAGADFVAGVDAQAEVDGVTGVDPPHLTLLIDSDVFQSPRNILPPCTVGAGQSDQTKKIVLLNWLHEKHSSTAYLYHLPIVLCQCNSHGTFYVFFFFFLTTLVRVTSLKTEHVMCPVQTI